MEQAAIVVLKIMAFVYLLISFGVGLLGALEIRTISGHLIVSSDKFASLAVIGQGLLLWAFFMAVASMAQVFALWPQNATRISHDSLPASPGPAQRRRW